MKLFRRDTAMAFGVFVFVFIAHSLCRNATSTDSHWIVPRMISMLSQGNTDLDEYPADLGKNEYRGVICADAAHRVWAPDARRGCGTGHVYNAYPAGAAVMALPPLIVMDGVLRVIGPSIATRVKGRVSETLEAFFRRDYVDCRALVEMILASFLIAVATALSYLLARLYLSWIPALLLAFLFAFGTSAWSTGSRALWQHGPDMLAIVCTLYLLAKSRTRPALVACSGFSAAFAYFIRPTSALFAVAIGVYVLFHRRKYFLGWILAALAAIVPFLAFNILDYGRLLQPYFTQQVFLPLAPSSISRLIVALAGQCISPSRGLFVFSPFLLFSAYGAVVAIGRRWETPLTYYLIAALLAHWLVISAFLDWTAGYSYGPRYFSDVLPIFMFFLIPLLQENGLVRRSRAAASVFALFALISIGIHYRGAMDWAVEEWNTPNLAQNVWNWRDPQFLRGL